MLMTLFMKESNANKRRRKVMFSGWKCTHSVLFLLLAALISVLCSPTDINAIIVEALDTDNENADIGPESSSGTSFTRIEQDIDEEAVLDDAQDLLGLRFGQPVGVVTSFLQSLGLLAGLELEVPVGTDERDDIGTVKADKGIYNGATQQLCATSSCCFIHNEERCSLTQIQEFVDSDEDDGIVDSAPDYGSVLVFPGANTSCIFENSTSFAFQVWPGSSASLLVYFQGGGACWNKLSTDVVTLCTTESQPNGQTGVFNRTDPENPFVEYTIVHILYCSGDLFVGNATRSYESSDGGQIRQKGADNTDAVLSWIVEQQIRGNLEEQLENLVIMGCSAGSIGAQLWSTTFLDRISYSKAAIVADSYVGVFPLFAIEDLMFDLNVCTWLENNGVTPSSIVESCHNRSATIQTVVGSYILATSLLENPVPWGFVQSKSDLVQQAFYDILGLTTIEKYPERPFSSSFTNPDQFYRDVNLILERYSSIGNNVIPFLIDGSQHCFTCYKWFYTADTLNRDAKALLNDDGISEIDSVATVRDDNNTTYLSVSNVTLLNWTRLAPLTSEMSWTSECTGLIRSEMTFNGIRYCDSHLVNVTFTQP